MHKRIKLLRLLADGELHSGDKLGNTLGVSRTAIWKIINSLEQYGIKVNSVKGKGYHLSRPIEFLDRDILLFEISSSAARILNSLEIFEEIDSTNQYLLENLAVTDKHAGIVLTEYQTHGRGRRGRAWVSPIGAGISLSVAWHFDRPVDSLKYLSLAAGSAVIRVLERMGFVGVGLKWPNDIFFDGRKLGGLLVEMRGEIAGPCDVVLGLGLNFAFPSDFEGVIEQAWIDLASIKQLTLSRNSIVAEFISEIILLLHSYTEIKIEDIVSEWRKNDCMCGKKAKLTLQDKLINGFVEGIDDDGALLMSVDNKIQKYTAGEISLRIDI